MSAPLTRWWLIGAGFVHFAAGHPARLLRSARVLDVLYRGRTRRGRGAASTLYALALFEGGRFGRLSASFSANDASRDPMLDRLVGQALLRDGKPEMARLCFKRWIEARPTDPRAHRLLGASFVAERRFDDAGPAFARSIELLPNSAMAHQNAAGRYDVAAYRPPRWERDEGARLLVYDILGQLAEAQERDGRFAESFALYRDRVLFQRELARDRRLPAELLRRIAKANPRFDPALPVRILPDEWVTQLGHLAMLAAQRKMIELGMLPPANYLVLAPARKVANLCYLDYFDPLFCILRDPGLTAAIFPYQRFFGDSFMATAGHTIEPWTLAAARAEIAWGDRPPLLRLRDEDREFGRETLRALGLPDGAWYVGLHVREAGFYGEAAGEAGEHRNADIGSYMPAVGEITRRGGWTIRLGDRSMRPLPATPGLIDYARSPLKSPRMDVFLLATSRMIIGTTSGLTTAAQVFGTPLLLANCVSNDWQYWHRATHFILKRVYERAGGRVLSLAETYRQPVQGLLASALALRRHGYAVHDNSSDEILEATRYKLDRLADPDAGLSENDRSLVERYRRALHDNPLIFGAAEPVAPFLARHPDLLNPADITAGHANERAENFPA